MRFTCALLVVISARIQTLSKKNRRRSIHAFLTTLFMASGLCARAQNTIKVPADQPTIQAGINAAQNGDTVLVSPGTYYENIDFKGKAITVISSNGSTATVIDGGSSAPTVSFVTNETNASIISGFTIQHGGQHPTNFLPIGAVYVSNAAPSIVGNIVTHNLCVGIYSYISAPLILNNEISFTDDPNNNCPLPGSGVILAGDFGSPPASPAVPVVTGNTIEQNTHAGLEDSGDNGGAGIAVWTANAVIENNIIRNNTTYDGTGGGVNIFVGGVLLIQNLIYGNAAGCGGGGVAFGFGSNRGPDAVNAFVINNTIANNTVNGDWCGMTGGRDGSQIATWAQSSQTEFANNIISASQPSKLAVFCGPTWYSGEPQLTIFDHNDVFAPPGLAYGGVYADQSGSFGNISSDPLFVNVAGSDFHLKAGSPAIDAGNNSALQHARNNSLAVDKDLDGNPREQDATGKGYPVVDMGVYEYAGSQDAAPTTILLTPSAYQLNAGNPVTLTGKLISPNGTPTGPLPFLRTEPKSARPQSMQLGRLPFKQVPWYPAVTLFLQLIPAREALRHPNRSKFTYWSKIMR